MSEFELNKIFAAILCAGITLMLANFIAGKAFHGHELERNAVEIEGGEVAAGGPVKQQLPEPILHLIATADIAAGEKLSKACAACHSFDKGGVNKVGPNLWKTVGGKKGHIDGYAYSDALLAHGGAWDYAELNKFLWKPKKHISGTKMNYIGIKQPEKRAAMIAWLRTLGSTSYPLPTQAQIAAEKAELAPPEPEVTEETVEAAAETVAE